MAKIVENDDLLDLAIKATADADKQLTKMMLSYLKRELTAKGVWEKVKVHMEETIDTLNSATRVSDHFYFTLLHLYQLAEQRHGNEKPILFHLDGMETTIALFTSDEDFAGELGFDGEEIEEETTEEPIQKDGFIKD